MNSCTTHLLMSFISVKTGNRQNIKVTNMGTLTVYMYMYMIKINEPQLPWLRTAIYHTGLDIKMEVTQCAGCVSTNTMHICTCTYTHACIGEIAINVTFLSVSFK